MDEEYLVSGPVRTVTLERAESEKTLFSLKEGDRQFIGRLVFNEAGLPVEKRTTDGIVIYNRDSAGNLVREDYFDTESHPLSVREVTRDTNRKLIFEKEGNRVTVKKYNETGEIIKEQRFLEEQLELIIDITLTPDGRPSTREYREGNGRFLRKESFEYDNRGWLHRFRCVGDSGALLVHDLYEYPQEYCGNWLKRIRYTVREEGNRVREIPVEILYRNIITDREESFPEAESGERALVFPDGTYRGEVKRNLMHGRGVLTFNDGCRYEGDFVGGIMEGRGIFDWPDGRHYEGDFHEGRMEGSGICQWPNGDSYKGRFSGGMMHGTGTFTWSSGARFTGLFEKNKRTDQGLIEPETDKE